jgi:hypothetical protein
MLLIALFLEQGFQISKRVVRGDSLFIIGSITNGLIQDARMFVVMTVQA